MTEEANHAELMDAADSIEARWADAVALAKQWKPGMMRSAWTGPLEALVHEREHVVRQLGDNPAALKVPKSMRADAQEKALPEHVRGAYRRGVYVHGRMRKALAKRLAAEKR